MVDEARTPAHADRFQLRINAHLAEAGYDDPIRLHREGHLLTVAPTGAGKGLGCIVPARPHDDGTAIVVVPNGGTAAITAGRWRAMGQEVVILDPMGISAAGSGQAVEFRS